MNSFGAMLRQVASLGESSDRERMFHAYLDSLSAEDLTAVASFLSPQPGPGPFPTRRLRRLLERHCSQDLFSLSYAYVGELTETIALLWPETPGSNRPVTPAGLASGLRETGQLELPGRMSQWLSGADAAGRHAIIRIASGTLRNPLPKELLARSFPFKGTPLPLRTANLPANAQGELFPAPLPAEAMPGETDAILLYVEKPRARSGDLVCTFGLWSGDGLVPVARVQAGAFSPAIAAFLASHTTRRFGPAHEVAHDATTALAARIGFDGIDGSTSHRAGMTLRAPRLISVTAPASVHDADDIAALTSGLPIPGAHG